VRRHHEELPMSQCALIRRLISGQPVERCGFWPGNPHPESWSILHRRFGTSSEEQLRQRLGDDVRRICPPFSQGASRAPEGTDTTLEQEACA
jgi:hypothetical protein